MKVLSDMLLWLTCQWVGFFLCVVMDVPGIPVPVFSPAPHLGLVGSHQRELSLSAHYGYVLAFVGYMHTPTLFMLLLLQHLSKQARPRRALRDLLSTAPDDIPAKAQLDQPEE